MVNFKLKTVNEDFIVREVSFFPPFKDKSTSTYSYISIEKEGLTTFDLIERLKDYFGIDFSDIAMEGLKDEDGMIEQLASIKKILETNNQISFNNFLKEKTKRQRCYPLSDMEKNLCNLVFCMETVSPSQSGI